MFEQLAFMLQKQNENIERKLFLILCYEGVDEDDFDIVYLGET